MLRPPRMLRTVDRKWREATMVTRGFQSASHPILAQIVPVRRCNLACAYCNHDRLRAVAARLLGARS